MSSFVWLDCSERKRRKMLDVVDLFREHDTGRAWRGVRARCVRGHVVSGYQHDHDARALFSSCRMDISEVGVRELILTPDMVEELGNALHRLCTETAAQPLASGVKLPAPVRRFERRLVFILLRNPHFAFRKLIARSLLGAVHASRDYLRHPVGACNISI